MNPLLCLMWMSAPLVQELAPEGYVLQDADVWGASTLRGPVPETHPAEPASPIYVVDWRVLRGDEDTMESALVEYSRDPEGLDFEAWPRSEDLSDEASLAAAFARVHVDADQVRMVRARGARCVGLRGELFQGDPEGNGHRGVPIQLRAGWNSMVAFGQVSELELWEPTTRMVIASWAVVPPPVTRELSSWSFSEVAVPVFNASALPSNSLHVHYGDGVPDQDGLRPRLAEWQDGGRIAPLALSVRHPYFGFLGVSIPGVEVASSSSALFPVCIYDSQDGDAARRLLRIPLLEPGSNPVGSGSKREPRDPEAVADLFEQAEWFVYGTTGSSDEARAALARARFEQQRLWYATGHAPEVISDEEWLDIEEKYASGMVVIYGNRDTNGAWQRLVVDEEGFEVQRGSARLAGEPDREGEHHAGFALRSRGDVQGAQQDLLVLFDTGPVGTRRGAVRDPRTLTGIERSGFFRAP